MVLESLHGKMAGDSRVIGKKVINMEKAWLLNLMVEEKKGNGFLVDVLDGILMS